MQTCIRIYVKRFFHVNFYTICRLVVSPKKIKTVVVVSANKLIIIKYVLISFVTFIWSFAAFVDNYDDERELNYAEGTHRVIITHSTDIFRHSQFMAMIHHQ